MPVSEVVAAKHTTRARRRVSKLAGDLGRKTIAHTDRFPRLKLMLLRVAFESLDSTCRVHESKGLRSVIVMIAVWLRRWIIGSVQRGRHRPWKRLIPKCPHAHVTDETVSRSTPNYVVTLVHGTWARRTNWIRHRSSLCKRLHKELPGLQLCRSVWTGRNSIHARNRAAMRLLERLNRQSRQWPSAQHFIVAHSHGGNVAMYALN